MHTATIPSLDLERLKRDTRILDVLTKYGIEAKPQGRGYMARCPFHEDDTPSLSVDPVKNVWHCFGCDAGGSVIDFVMKKESLTFREATEKLLLNGGPVKRASQLTPPSSFAKATEDRPTKSQGIEPKLIESVIGHYEKTLAGSDTNGLNYLKRRGLADPATLKTFRVGYVNGSLKSVLPASAVEPLQRLGILNDKGNEFFYGCIVIPVFTATGELGEMYGRSVEGCRHLYLPGQHRGVLNAKAAEVYEDIILTEAVLDALSLYAIGVKNVIPCYGTGGFQGLRQQDQSAVALREGGTASADTHYGLLMKHNVKRIFIAFDNDEAGENGAKKLAATLSAQGVECHRVHLPDLDGKVKDLNDYVRHLRGQGMTAEEVKAAFAELLKHAPRVGYTRPKRAGSLNLAEQTEDTIILQNTNLTYRLRGLFDNDGNSLRVIVTAQHEDLFHTDRVDLYGAKSRSGFAYRAAHRLELPAPKLEEDLHQMIPLLETILSENKSRAEEQKARKVPPMSEAERVEALAPLRSPKLLEQIMADIQTVGFVGEEQNKLLAYLIATSRKLDKPLSAIIRSESGAGKSYLMECIADLMPPEDVKYYSRLTPQSLYYMGKEELVHKLLIVDERDGSEEAEYPIRTLQTRRILTLAVPVKDPARGTTKTIRIEIYGPIAYMESTTSTHLNPENANRNFEIYLDESEDQTRRIYQAQKRAHTLAGWKDEDRRARAIRLHHNAQRLLEPVRVLIPYTEAIRFPESWTRGRRDNERLLFLVEAITFLHQHQRELKHDPQKGEYIEATIEDYAAAYALARTALGHALCDIPGTARAVLSHIQAMVGEWSQRLGVSEKDYGFRRRDVREYTKLPDHVVKRAMQCLADLEYVQVKGHGRGGSFLYRLTARPSDKDVLAGLTTPEELRKAWHGKEPRS